MSERRGRSAVVPLALALLALLAVGTGAVAERTRTPGAPDGTRAIAPPYTTTVTTYLDAAVPMPFDARVSAPRLAVPAARTAASAAAKPVACTGRLPAVPAAPAEAARALNPNVPVYDRPDGRVVRTLSNPTREGQPLNFQVVGRSGAWVRVMISMRPNGSNGWVRMTDVGQFQTPYRIVIQLCAHRLTLFRSGQAVWQQPVAIGAPRTPTPTGAFFVDYVVPMRASGAYGPYLMSVSGYSNVLHQFGKGGIGQIGIHGTNRPSSIGTSASHGCVRLHNDALLHLVRTVPAGTPVTIVA